MDNRQNNCKFPVKILSEVVQEPVHYFWESNWKRCNAALRWENRAGSWRWRTYIRAGVQNPLGTGRWCWAGWMVCGWEGGPAVIGQRYHFFHFAFHLAFWIEMPFLKPKSPFYKRSCVSKKHEKAAIYRGFPIIWPFSLWQRWPNLIQMHPPWDKGVHGGGGCKIVEWPYILEETV